MANEQGPLIATNPGPRNADRRQRDSLFCMPCKRLRVFVESHIFHKCQQTSKGLSHFPRRYRETCQMYSAKISVYTSKLN